MSGAAGTNPATFAAAARPRARRPRAIRLGATWLPGLLYGMAVPASLLLLWHVATSHGWVTPLILPAPADVLAALRDMTRNGDLGTNLQISLSRMAAGFAAGAAAGLFVGGLIGLSRSAEALLRPFMMGLVQVPVLAWIPLLMIPFGIGPALKLAAIGIATFAPVLVNTAKGFRQVSPALIEVGTLYRFSAVQRVRHILAPGALPAIFTGLRLGLTASWHSLVVVELVASTEGIGYQVVMARQMFQLDVMLATMLVIGAVGFTLDRFLSALEANMARRFGAVAA